MPLLNPHRHAHQLGQIAGAGWIAGDIIATDPIVAEQAHAFGASVAKKIEITIAVLGVFAVLGAGFIARNRQQVRHAVGL